ncbi:MAG: CrcB family protein [Micrococcales bacterium]|nr:CrcB family protein [Micrococcales bacterium]
MPEHTPAHHDPRLLLLVFLGGSLGTAVRAALEGAFPARAGGWPWATFAINVTGAFLLGLLLETLARRGPDSGWRRQVRLGAGTGLLGGYTTYSTFAVETARLTTPLAMGYAAGTAVLGCLAAAAGYAIARRRPSDPVPEPGA